MSESPTSGASTLAAQFLPLTELREDLLATLVLDGVDGNVDYLFTPNALAWARKAGFAQLNADLEDPRHQVTMSGRRLLAVHRKHAFSTHRRLLGHSPIRGGGSSYGLGLRCRCGFKSQTNESGSRGKGYLLADYRKHAAEVLTELEQECQL